MGRAGAFLAHQPHDVLPVELHREARRELVRNDDHLREVTQIFGTLDRLARLGAVPDAQVLDAALLELHDALSTVVPAGRVPPDALAVVAKRLQERNITAP